MFPTRQSLGLMKNKLKGAETGHSLLKRKSEALTKYVLRSLRTLGLDLLADILSDDFEVGQDPRASIIIAYPSRDHETY